MEKKTPIPFNIDTDLQQGEYYATEVKPGSYINFTYDQIGNSGKPFLLDNNCRLNHVPVLSDTGANNLKPINVDPSYTEEQNREIASRGGKKAAENHLKRKSFKESIELMLSLRAGQEQLKNIDSSIVKHLSPEDIEQLTQEDLIVLKAVELAQLGSDKHQTFLRDTAGEKPTDNTRIEADIMTDGDRLLLDKISKRLQENT